MNGFGTSYLICDSFAKSKDICKHLHLRNKSEIHKKEYDALFNEKKDSCDEFQESITLLQDFS